MDPSSRTGVSSLNTFKLHLRVHAPGNSGATTEVTMQTKKTFDELVSNLWADVFVCDDAGSVGVRCAEVVAVQLL